MEKLYFDVVIIGGGASGLRAALEIKKSENLSCAVISKIHPLRSQSCMAQGGMNAALNNNTNQGEDSVQAHFEDTVIGGDFLGDQDVIQYFCEQAPRCVIELEHMGMIFSRMENGKIAQRPFGGGMFPRTCYSRDFTGHILISTLYQECLKNDVNFLSEWYVPELLVEDGVIKGVLAYDIANLKQYEISAKAVIIATGGASTIYDNTVNAVTSTGEGMSLAYQEGALLKDMEFVQFHPTGLANKGILLTEGARGEGGYLLNCKGERFMERYDARKMELAKRDIICRAIQNEIDEGRGIDGCVLLDLTHLGEKKLKTLLPQVYSLVNEFAGIDPVKTPIPVRPTAHYFIGGIDVNKDCETSIKGLFAVGECASTGIHGANRLGGNSLMETIVFGKSAGKNAAIYAKNSVYHERSFDPSQGIFDDYEKILHREKGVNPYKIKKKLKSIMDRDVGIFRTSESLKSAVEKIKHLKEEYNNVACMCRDKIFNFSYIETLELENMLIIAEVVAEAALKRQESRGAHYRQDFKNRNDDNYLKHSIIYYCGSEDNNQPRVEYRDVKITKLKP